MGNTKKVRKARFTPGPWSWEQFPNGSTYIRRYEDGAHLTLIRGSKAEKRANARLVVEAPAMLELISVLAKIDCLCEEFTSICQPECPKLQAQQLLERVEGV